MFQETEASKKRDTENPLRNEVVNFTVLVFNPTVNTRQLYPIKNSHQKLDQLRLEQELDEEKILTVIWNFLK